MRRPSVCKWIGRVRLVLVPGVLLLGCLVLLPGAVSAEGPSVEQIREAIREQALSWTAREYDRTFVMGLIPLAEDSKPLKKSPAGSEPLSLPTSLNWRNHRGNLVSPAKNQHHSGSSWASASVGTFESMYAISSSIRIRNPKVWKTDG